MECEGPNCCAQDNRRNFLKLSALGAAAMAAWRPVMAGPFEDHVALIPIDKKLDPKWIASLTARGEPEIHSGLELKYIGMPIGGLCAGAVYIGGDGKLWLWDIFNKIANGVLSRDVDCEGKKVNAQNGANYVSPLEQNAPFDFGFCVRIDKPDLPKRAYNFDKTDFKDITFRGEYPVATINYREPGAPISAKLTAYSPFCPLNAQDSSFPAIVMSFTLKNELKENISADIMGWLENPVCHKRDIAGAERHIEFQKHALLTAMTCSARAGAVDLKNPRPEIVFDDFEKETYEGWTVEGTAFGKGPIKKSEMPKYQGDVGSHGERLVNSHNVREGGDVAAGDRHKGTLTSKEFTIERNYINFLIDGGNHPGKTCVNLLIDGKVARTATGHDNNRMREESFDVHDLLGKLAKIQVVDNESGGWGNIGIDNIVFSDKPAKVVKLDELPDFGTMTLAFLNPEAGDGAGIYNTTATGVNVTPVAPDTVPLAHKLSGSVHRKFSLAAGAETTVTFVITWHFPNLTLGGMGKVGRHYASRFDSSYAVASTIAEQFNILSSLTMLWRDTWNDSTLPHWFLNRTFLNTSILATSTCHRFADGKFWGWEGVGCCEGTCTHVWHYAQAVARIFPELERDLRERTDFGQAFQSETGMIGHRGHIGNGEATDGQAGNVIRAYREHTMAPNSDFLTRNWAKIKKALHYLIARDALLSPEKTPDGMIEASQPNTLDAAWFGKIPAIASLYLAALRAGEIMSREMNDPAFEKQCAELQASGREQLEKLFNGEFFIQEEDPKHLDAIGVGKGCYIDQVFGQSWAHQLALGRLFDEKKIKTALESLYKFNFAPDVGPLRKSLAPSVRGRPYALAGDAGLVMCTWPRGGKRNDWEKHWQFMYFSECMSGFEWQAAGHMIWEGLLTEGLAVARAIHDRYHPRLRNPYNEIECSDHYARAMASYGAFLAACGFEYHGPKGHFGFDPKINPRNFKAAFAAAEGWGSIAQKFDDAAQMQSQSIEVKYGKLRVQSLAFVFLGNVAPKNAAVKIAGVEAAAKMNISGQRVSLTLNGVRTILSGQSLNVSIS